MRFQVQRGIVVLAGGSTYFTNAYVLVRMLRWHRCELPIQLWYSDESEWHPNMAKALDGLGVTFQNASEIKGCPDHPWARKPFAVAHSPFDEVLLLDADIVPLRDVGNLFTEPSYLETGALFWSDCSSLSEIHPIWRCCGIKPDTGPGFQGGQQLINKVRCAEALRVTLLLNQDAHVWYHMVYGEQDLYRMAWKITNTPYSMVEHAPEILDRAMIAHDPQGLRLFQHRCGEKWHLSGNRHIPGFWYEPLCEGFLNELREFFPQWVPKVTTDLQMHVELEAYLDRLKIDADNIGDIRRACGVPWDSEWNGIVRDLTAKREQLMEYPAAKVGS